MSTSGVATLSLEQIEDLAAGALRRAGASELQTGATSRSIREAEAEGIRNVGLGYLGTYCLHLQCGKVVGDAIPTIEPPSGATLRVDAALGFCHPAFELAMDPFVGLAQANGIALLAIQRSYSAGVLGWMVDLLAQRGLIAFGFANSSPLVAPWGGSIAKLGTNPLAFAVPRTGHRPLVVDMATSATAYVNVLQAANEGREIPLGWAIGPDGQSTTDPKLGLAGTIAPLGGAKGFGLSLMVEILAAGVAGGNWGIHTSSFGDDQGGPPGVGQVFLAIDPSRSAPDFAQRLEYVLADFVAEDGVRLPGDRRHDHRSVAEREGVAVPDELIASLTAVGP